MSKRGYISEEKAKKIAVGATVGGVLLIIFLLVVLIIQFVQIGVRNSEKARLKEEIARYEQMVDESREDLRWYKELDGLWYHARQQGWT